ncbi:MAG: hypothetical protein ACOVS5_06810 [Oligoflexus sp.]|jgi:hypothetical protein
MDGIAAAAPATSRLKQAATGETGADLDLNRTQTHQATGFVLLLDLFDNSGWQKLDPGGFLFHLLAPTMTS